MAAKKQKTNSKRPSPPAQSSSRVRTAIVGTMFNVVATAATFGTGMLCLIVAKHFT
jgi:hypothetical protein